MSIDKVILACKNRELNFYKGQKRDANNKIILASANWKSVKYINDHFTICSKRGNPSFMKLNVLDSSTFEHFNFSQQLFQGIEQQNLSMPTLIQKLAIPVIKSGRNTLIAAETGSGKTLAYLAPILDNLQLHGLTDSDVTTPPAKPKAVITVPGRELVSQIYSVALKTSLFTNLKVCLGLSSENQLPASISEQHDILISTPGVLNSCLEKGLLDFSSVKHFVIDEADSLLDDTFSNLVLSIAKGIQFQVHKMPSGHAFPGAQLILASATFPRDLDTLLAGIIDPDNLEHVTTQSLHNLLPHVPQRFMRTTEIEKWATLVMLLRTDARKVKERTLVFVNKEHYASFYVVQPHAFLQDIICIRDCFTKPGRILIGNQGFECLKVAKFLEEQGIESVGGFSGKITFSEREETLERFQNGSLKVLVASDLASRGLDTCLATHVINFGFPGYISDYIHRCGRVGRIGSPTYAIGRVTNLVSKKSQVDLVQLIEYCARTGASLPDVNANIKSLRTGGLRHTAVPEDSDPYHSEEIASRFSQ